MARTTPSPRAATRALAVLAVLLGLVAMHGLADTHHAAAATTGVQHGAGQHQAAQAAPGHDHHAAARVAAPAAVPDADVLAVPAGLGCEDGCPDLAVLCVAVLAGALLLALLLARRRARLLRGRPRHDRAATAKPVRVPRPPDPVKELCVSRT